MKNYYNHFCLKIQKRIEGVFYVGHRKKHLLMGTKQNMHYVSLHITTKRPKKLNYAPGKHIIG